MRQKIYQSDGTQEIANYRFRICSSDQQLVKDTSSVFLKTGDGDFELIDLDSPNNFPGEELTTNHPSAGIKRVISTVQSVYEQYLFLDACCLLAQGNRVVLIVGTSFAGKSTTAVAAALGFGWKIVSEDLVFIDQKQNRIVAFPCPISLRGGASEFIESATGFPTGPLLYDRWFVDYNLFNLVDVPVRLSLAVCFDKAHAGNSMIVEKTTADEFARKIIPYGNWLTLPDAPEFLYNALQTSDCYVLGGGSLADRMRWFQQVMQQS